MKASQTTRNHQGRLTLSAGPAPASPPAFHQDTTLSQLRVALGAHRYVLATDDAGQLVGVVPRQRILERLHTPNDRERMRWESMHLGALIHAEIDNGSNRPAATSLQDRECVAVTENDSLVAIAVEDDVFLSLRRLEPTLAAAKCDPLTGLMNRLGYERRLNEEWSRATRTKTSIAVMMLDLDGFKQINDRFGHPAGDVVLRGVASILESTLRSYDVVARYGGDEFVALCLDCRPGGIQLPILRIQQELKQHVFEYGNETLTVSASIGAAVRHADFEDSSPSELFAAADDCVYQSKRTVRNPHVIEFGGEAQETMLSLEAMSASKDADALLIG